MIRPVAFRRNEETAENNFYQQEIKGLSDVELQTRALREFDAFVTRLRAEGIRVIVVNDTPDPSTPDSIFPNNWISFHEDGSIMLYPMFAVNRRHERREHIWESLRSDFTIGSIDSITRWEDEGKFLEGTGSLILDRVNKLAYAAVSERTHPDLIDLFCDKKGYEAVVFHSYQTVNDERLPIYHTNVMMCIGEAFALICADSIDDQEERKATIAALQNSGKEVIEITEAQNNCFAGNMLQVKNTKEDRFVVMSEAAFKSLSADQIKRLEKHGQILYSNINTIETLGGGSARCMMAEVFLPRKN